MQPYIFIVLVVFTAPSRAEVVNRLPGTCASLLASHRIANSSARMPRSIKLEFAGVGTRDVYNPTKPFAINFKGRLLTVIAARVEARDSELSEVMFFTEVSGLWHPLAGAPVFEMQDPFFTFIGGELIFGGVEVSPRPGGGMGYKTIFFRGESLEELNPQHPFAKGPANMKDIRLVELSAGRIGLFTRPQGLIPGTSIDAGPGRIGFKVIHSVDELKRPENILNAPLIAGQFQPKEWGGVNEAQLLPDGRIAVLIHVARFDAKGNRHYHSAVFTMNLNSGFISPIEIILERADLAHGYGGASKRKDLVDVVFSGGLILTGYFASLYVGAGDAEVHMKEIPRPPFVE